MVGAAVATVGEVRVAVMGVEVRAVARAEARVGAATAAACNQRDEALL